LSESLNKFLYSYLGLLEDTSQCPNSQFAMQRHNASHLTVWRLFLEYYVAASLPRLLKA
jgi:hypothetical protein